MGILEELEHEGPREEKKEELSEEDQKVGEGPPPLPPPPPPSFGHHHYRVPLTATGPAGLIDVRGGPAPVADATNT